MKTSATFIASALLLFNVALVDGATLAEEDFESYTAGSQVHGLNGGAGFTSAWNVPSAARRPEFTIVNGGLNYSGGSLVVNGGNRAAQYLATEGGIAILAGRDLPAQSGAIYLSFLYSQSNEIGDDDFMQFGFDTSATSPRVSALDRNGEFQVRSTTSAGNSVGSGVSSDAGDTYFVVLKADKTGASVTYNDLMLWVDPLSSDEGANPALAVSTVDSGLDLSGAAAFAIRKAFQESGDTFLIDQIRIGQTFADVTANVPEPASIAIWAVIGFAAIGIRYGVRRVK